MNRDTIKFEAIGIEFIMNARLTVNENIKVRTEMSKYCGGPIALAELEGSIKRYFKDAVLYNEDGTPKKKNITYKDESFDVYVFKEGSLAYERYNSLKQLSEAAEIYAWFKVMTVSPSNFEIGEIDTEKFPELQRAFEEARSSFR